MTRIKTTALGLAIVAAMFGGIAISMAAGYWKTESTKEPVKIKEGEFAGLPNPADVRGSYTWDDVAKAFAIPVEKVLEAFGATDPAQKANSLEAKYAGTLPEGVEIGTGSVRLFAALYTGLPYEADEGTVLPASAITVLRADGKADKARIDEAAAKAISVTPAAPAPSAPAAAPSAAAAPAKAAPAAPAVPAAAAPAPAPAAQAKPATPAAPTTTVAAAAAQEHTPATGTIVGKTTFGDLAGWGYDMKKVEAILGGLGPSSQSIRDFCEAKGIEFSTVKTSLNELAK
jgi:hypothetical protein